MYTTGSYCTYSQRNTSSNTALPHGYKVNTHICSNKRPITSTLLANTIPQTQIHIPLRAFTDPYSTAYSVADASRSALSWTHTPPIVTDLTPSQLPPSDRSSDCRHGGSYHPKVRQVSNDGHLLALKSYLSLVPNDTCTICIISSQTVQHLILHYPQIQAREHSTT